MLTLSGPKKFRWHRKIFFLLSMQIVTEAEMRVPPSTPSPVSLRAKCQTDVFCILPSRTLHSNIKTLKCNLFYCPCAIYANRFSDDCYVLNVLHSIKIQESRLAWWKKYFFGHMVICIISLNIRLAMPNLIWLDWTSIIRLNFTFGK